jgi:DNA-binding HxlR family transcriptional regulator
MVKVRKNRVKPPPEECPLNECLKLLRGAWSPHVIWYLRDTPRRFSELKGDLHGVSAKVLSARLRELQRAGVIERTEMNTSPPTVEYALTDLGHQLRPALAAIVDVGHRLKLRRR